MARIVVADGDTLHLDMVLTALERAGHSVVGVTSGPNCLARAKEGACDLVIADVGLAGEGEENFIESLHRHSANVPVIGMTSMSAGFADAPKGKATLVILAKPFTPAELRDEVEKALVGYHAEGSRVIGRLGIQPADSRVDL